VQNTATQYNVDDNM